MSSAVNSSDISSLLDLESARNRSTPSTSSSSTPLAGTGNVRRNNTTPTTSDATITPNTAQPPSEGDRSFAQLEQSLNMELSRHSGYLKIYIPFFLLLFIKFLINHLATGLLVLSFLVGIKRLRDVLDIQLSLKSHMNTKVLIWTTFIASMLLLSFYSFLDMLEYGEDLQSRMLFVYASKGEGRFSFFEVMWNCWLTDLFVQIFSLLVRSLLCLGLSSEYLSSFRRTCQSSNRGTVGCLGLIMRTLRLSPSTIATNCHDIESGATSVRASNSSHRQQAPTPTAGVGLVTRRTVSTSDSLASQTTTAQADDSSASETSDAASMDGLLMRKLSNLVEMSFYLYRSLLPIPLWVDYLKGGAFGKGLFPVLYVALKLADVSLKLRGYAEALEYFAGHKPEYGRYSTSSEYDAHCSNHDCPICFDRPQRPVTLPCNHIFCESCVVAWLEKERTCPVCRAEVPCTASSLGTMKKEALTFTQVLI
eukprot:gene5251-5785_t